MGKYKQLNFKNHPSIATELVNFLVINTSFEAIEKLTLRVAQLEIEATETKKTLVASEKASSSAGNKADKANRLCNQLAKQVAKHRAAGGLCSGIHLKILKSSIHESGTFGEHEG
jgi:hypothetical protein